MYAAGGNEDNVFLSVCSVIDKIPYDFTVRYDLSTLFKPNPENQEDIMWVDLEIINPVPKILKIPFRGIGVIRDPETGKILKVNDFEIASNLIADVGDVLRIIGCILLCAGLACGWECAAACITVVLCVECIIACAGASAVEIAECIHLCEIGTEGLS